MSEHQSHVLNILCNLITTVADPCHFWPLGNKLTVLPRGLAAPSPRTLLCLGPSALCSPSSHGKKILRAPMDLSSNVEVCSLKCKQHSESEDLRQDSNGIFTPYFVVPIVPQSHNGKNFFKQFLDSDPNPDDFQSDFLVQRYVSGINEDPISIVHIWSCQKNK